MSTVRAVLVSHKIPLRANHKATASAHTRPQRAFWGAIPYGHTVLDGKVVVDPKELKIVRKILLLHQKGMSFNAISISLNNQNIPSKLGKRWNDKTVAAIIRRNTNSATTGDINGT